MPVNMSERGGWENPVSTHREGGDKKRIKRGTKKKKGELARENMCVSVCTHGISGHYS